MKNMNTKYFMMLTLLAVGSMNISAMEEMEEAVEIQSHREDSSFFGQKGRIQNQLHDIKRDARTTCKMKSGAQLDRIAMEIDALAANPEFRNETMHDHEIRVLRRELQHARNIVRDHGMENGAEVKVQTASTSNPVYWF